MADDTPSPAETVVSKPAAEGRWPRQMRAETAAAYCDETSVPAFLRAIPRLYPEPCRIPGKGPRWRKEQLDAAISRIHGLTDERPVRMRDLV